MRTTVSRRAFYRSLAGGLCGGSLLEAAAAEARTRGELSSQTVHALLEWIGYPPRSEEEAARMKPILHDTLLALEVIRSFEIPFALEPGVVFRPDRQ